MAMSSGKRSPCGFGTQSPSGLLPSRVSLPPVGAMVRRVLLPMMLAKPSSRAIHA
jgi:hypothetical protein